MRSQSISRVDLKMFYKKKKTPLASRDEIRTRYDMTPFIMYENLLT